MVPREVLVVPETWEVPGEQPVVLAEPEEQEALVVPVEQKMPVATEPVVPGVPVEAGVLVLVWRPWGWPEMVLCLIYEH